MSSSTDLPVQNIAQPAAQTVSPQQVPPVVQQPVAAQPVPIQPTQAPPLVQPQAPVSPPVQMPAPVSAPTKEHAPMPSPLAEIIMPSEPIPEIGEDVKEAGVEVSVQTNIGQDAQVAGVALAKESVPVQVSEEEKIGENFPMSKKQVTGILKMHKKIKDSIFWLALLISRQFKLAERKQKTA
ncbi:MAG: hypothetical protein ACREGI_04205 [Candidatus Levyibacteriota bacterium]